MALMERSRLVRWIAVGSIAVVALVLLVLAAFPWGVLRERVAASLSNRFGAPVSIGAIDRIEPLSFAPTLIVRDLRIAQPGWAGKGDLVHIGRTDIRFRVLPLLRGKFDLTALSIENGRVSLVRAADGRRNWAPERRGGGGSTSDFTRLTVRDLRIAYRDAVQDRRFAVTVTSDGQGFRAAGTGAVLGSPVDVRFVGPAIAGMGRWPFRAALNGPRLAIDARGTMGKPLDTDDLQATLTARADSLKTLDAVIEAGLFGTQPVQLSAKVSHAEPEWRVTGLSGTIGRSRLADAAVTVGKGDGRTTLGGHARFATLDFDDLADDAGQARGRAKAARTGPRTIPDTRIDLAKLDDVDGTIRVDAERLLFRGASPFRSLSATLALDHSRLTVRPLTVGLSRGRLGGSVVVDQRDRSTALLTLDLALTGSSIATFAGGGPVDAPLRGFARLTGPGDTIRSAVGRSNGTVALAGSNGTLPARLASLLGADVARGVLTDEDASATLRCLGFRMAVRQGAGRIETLLVDTSRAQTRGAGTIRLSDERLAIALTGTPKQRTVLRLDRPVRIAGTLRAPDIVIPEGVRSARSVLGMLGRAISGDQGARAGDANCSAMTAAALRR